MKSPSPNVVDRDHLSKEAVLHDLGDKVIAAISEAVAKTRSDRAEYRTRFPAWASSDSERGAANWIHDRMWDHLTRDLDSNPDVAIYERGPTREILVGGRIRIRVKRHTRAGGITTYPTETALSFYDQTGQLSFFGTTPDVSLAVGYVWDRDSREIGPPVISLRDGVDNLLWFHELAEAPAVAVLATPPLPDAPVPTVIIRDDGEQTSAAES